MNDVKEVAKVNPIVEAKADIIANTPEDKDARYTAMVKKLENLTADNEAMRKSLLSKNKITARVSQKGAVSLYGLGRFPVTLYKEQWIKVNTFMPDLMTFIEVNNDLLSVKE